MEGSEPGSGRFFLELDARVARPQNFKKQFMLLLSLQKETPRKHLLAKNLPLSCPWGRRWKFMRSHSPAAP